MKAKILLIIILGTLFSCSHTVPNQQQFTLWRNRVERLPASTTGSDFLKMAEDFLLLDDYGKSVVYRMETSFWTSKDKEYLHKKLKKVIQQTMHDVLVDLQSGKKDLGKKGAVTALIKEHAVEYILKEFVKTLYVYKIMNGNFEFNVSVVPYIDSPNNLDHEFDSNQLIILPVKGSLSEFLEQKDPGLPEKIAQVSFPVRDAPTFTGGNIALRIKLLDFDINPLKPIPNPKKNAVKGEIVVRRYYSMMLPQDTFENRELSMHLQKSEERKTFITVDRIYSFNLKKLIPQFKKTVVYLGVLQSRRHLKTGLLSHLTYLRFKNEKSVKGAKWDFVGKYKDSRMMPDFSVTFQQITFSKKHGVSIDVNVVNSSILNGEDGDSSTPFEFRYSTNELLEFLGLDNFFVEVAKEMK